MPKSKLALYTACGGIPPNMCLPICIDAGAQGFHPRLPKPCCPFSQACYMLLHAAWHACGGLIMRPCAPWNSVHFHHQEQISECACAGTNNEELLRSPFYVGCKHQRVRGDAYYELIDELMSAVKRRCGADVWHGQRRWYICHPMKCHGGHLSCATRVEPSIPCEARLTRLAFERGVLVPPSPNSSPVNVSYFQQTTPVLQVWQHLPDALGGHVVREPGRLFARYRGTFPCFSDDVQARIRSRVLGLKPRIFRVF